MKLTKLCLAMAGVMGVGMSAEALALDLYVDTKTQQIFAEPGKGRVLLGEFQKVGEAASPKSDSADLKAEIQQIKQDLALKTNELKALDEHVKDPNEGKVQIGEKGIKFESKDGNFEMAINGRMQVDAQTNVADASPITGSDPNAKITAGPEKGGQLADGANIRRARLGVEGSYYKDFEYKFEYDFSRGGNAGVAAGITDAYINWKGYDPFGVKIGSFKEPFSLEEATSNRWLTFIERNMAVNAFSDNPNAYKTGIGLTYSQPRWTAAGALMTEPAGGGWAYTSSKGSNGNNNRNGASGDTGWELTGRVTGMPWFEDKTKFWHVGASGSERYVNLGKCNTTGTGASTACSTGMTFNSTVNGNVDRTAILNTGLLQNPTNSLAVDTITRMGGETAVVYGPFSAQAEYIQADLSGKGYDNTTLYGYYGYASYFLTGESRAYKAKTGAWDRLKPKRNFDLKGGYGAWELAAGYDFLDLNDKKVNGGRASTAKFGVNWYPNSHLKMMANFIHVLDVQKPGSYGKPSNTFYDGSNLDMFELRGQVDF